MRSKFQGNVRKLIIINFLAGFILWYAVERFFLRDILSEGPLAVSVMVTVYLVTTLVFDIPSGILADRWGRRNVLALGFIIFIAAQILLGYTSSFMQYLGGTFLWSLYVAAYSGTYQAILYDSLKEDAKQHSFQKIYGLAQTWFMLGIAISSAVSGFVAEAFSLRYPYFVSVIPIALALFLTLRLKEPRLSPEQKELEETPSSHINHFLEALNSVIRSKVLLLVVFGTVIIFATRTPLYEFDQYIFIDLYNDFSTVGLINSVAGFALALGFWLSRHHIRGHVVYIILASIMVALLGITQNNVGILLVYVIYIFVAIFDNQMQTKLQHATKSKTRATVTSVVNFMGSLLVIPVLFIFGAVAEKSIWEAYGLLGIYLIFLATCYAFLQRKKATAPNRF